MQEILLKRYCRIFRICGIASSRSIAISKRDEKRAATLRTRSSVPPIISEHCNEQINTDDYAAVCRFSTFIEVVKEKRQEN